MRHRTNMHQYGLWQFWCDHLWHNLKVCHSPSSWVADIVTSPRNRDDCIVAFWQGDGSLGDNVWSFDYVRHSGACFSWELWENATCRHFQRIGICDQFVYVHLQVCILVVCVWGCIGESWARVSLCTRLVCTVWILHLTFLTCLLRCYLQAKANRWNAE